jgi:hypothetical protein
MGRLKTELNTRINSKDVRWFTKLMQNMEQVKQFITLGDDTILAAIFHKYCELTATKSGGLNHYQKVLSLEKKLFINLFGIFLGGLCGIFLGFLGISLEFLDSSFNPLCSTR